MEVQPNIQVSDDNTTVLSNNSTNTTKTSFSNTTNTTHQHSITPKKDKSSPITTLIPSSQQQQQQQQQKTSPLRVAPQPQPPSLPLLLPQRAFAQQQQQQQQQQNQYHWLQYDDGMIQVPYPSSWQVSRQNSILYFFSHLQLYTKNETKDNINVQVVISGDQSIESLAKEVIDSLSKLEGYQMLKNLTRDEKKVSLSSSSSSSSPLPLLPHQYKKRDDHHNLDNQEEDDDNNNKNQYTSMETVHFKARYKMHGSQFTQITHVIECGQGLKYLFTYTSNTIDLTTEPIFLFMLNKAQFRRVQDLPWNSYECYNCSIEYPQLWTRQLQQQQQQQQQQLLQSGERESDTNSTIFLFSPIQMVSQNRLTDNVVIQYITNGETLDNDIKQLFRQLEVMKNFQVVKDVTHCEIHARNTNTNNNDSDHQINKSTVSSSSSSSTTSTYRAVMFHVKYDYKGKSLEQITYLIQQPQSHNNNNNSHHEHAKWMLSYTSVGAQSKSLFEQMLHRFKLKPMK